MGPRDAHGRGWTVVSVAAWVGPRVGLARDASRNESHRRARARAPHVAAARAAVPRRPVSFVLLARHRIGARRCVMCMTCRGGARLIALYGGKYEGSRDNDVRLIGLDWIGFLPVGLARSLHRLIKHSPRSSAAMSLSLMLFFKDLFLM